MFTIRAKKFPDVVLGSTMNSSRYPTTLSFSIPEEYVFRIIEVLDMLKIPIISQHITARYQFPNGSSVVARSIEIYAKSADEYNFMVVLNRQLNKLYPTERLPGLEDI